MAEMTIKRFGVWSVAKMHGILWFIFGSIIGVIYGYASATAESVGAESVSRA